MLEEFIYPPICLLLFSFIYSKVDDVFVTELKPQLMEFTIKKTGFYILEVTYAHPSKLNPARSYPSTIFDYNYDPKRHFIFASHFENRLTRSIGQIHRVYFLRKGNYHFNVEYKELVLFSPDEQPQARYILQKRMPLSYFFIICIINLVILHEFIFPFLKELFKLL